MANLSSGTQKRPGDRDGGESGHRNGSASKRSRRESPAGDWRDVHLKERDPDRGGRGDHDKRRRQHSREKDRSREYRRDRDRRRSRSRERAPVVEPIVTAVGDDDEKEEGEISPRPPPDTHKQRDRHSSRRRSRSSSSSRKRTRSLSRRRDANGKAQGKDVEMREETPVAQPEPEPQEEKSIEDLMEERRRKRAAILAKHASGQSSVVGLASGMASSAGIAPSKSMRESATPPPPTVGINDGFALAKEDEDKDDKGDVEEKAELVKAADYDPSLDRREDERKRFGVEDVPAKGAPREEPMVIDDEEEVEVTDDEGEDVDDMFALAMEGEEDKPKKKKKKKIVRKAAPTTTALNPAASLMIDSAADPEGYYTVILGEYLDNGRYQVFSSLGKGMFANVVRARVLKEEDGSGGLVDVDGGREGKDGLREVAIKIIRCQEPMYKAGLKEAQILHKLRLLDVEDKKHVVKLERTFEHRGHLCLVFESLSMNLREVVKRFGKDVGLNVRAVRAYAHQLFLSLSLLKKANVMHADIKPDNILVNEQKNLLKLCDLGSASDASENEITPYLVSRFYRAPEIILGVPYDPSLDVWSVGCTLYELYTGKILFPGKSNAHMLLLMMEVKGRFNSKLLKRAKFADKYFDSLGNFVEAAEKDLGLGKEVVVNRVNLGNRGTRDLRSRIMASSVGLKEEEVKLVGSLVDLLEKCLVLDPGRRITPKEALNHPFIRG